MISEAAAAEGRLLAPLSEDSFLHNLQARYQRDIIYTWVHGVGGPVLCVNPGRPLALYTAAEARRHAAGTAEPHAYGAFAAALRARARGRPQLVTVTGVSGAGKTEAARLCLQAAVVAGGGGAAGSRLAAAGTLLEAFGNAATALNHNASRFGKLLDIEYDYKDEIVGGHITHYLLERSRCGRVCDGERGFHVFYQLLAGADCRTLRSLRLQRGAHAYRALGSEVGDESQDAAHFSFTTSAMSALGIDEDTRSHVWRVLAFLLKLGQLEFMPAHNVDGTLGVRVRNERELEEACDVVGLDANAVLRALGAGAGTAEEDALAAEAEAARDTLSGAIYERLFSWLVAAVNRGAAGDRATGPPLGVLDMYGLESLSRNGLERLLINCAAERVQAVVTRYALVSRRERAASDDACESSAPRWIESPAVALLTELAVEREEEDVRRRPRDEDRAPDRFTVKHFGGVVRYACVRREDAAERGAGAVAVRRFAGAARCSACPVLVALFPDGSPRRSPRRPAPRPARQSALLAALETRAATADVRVVHCVKADAHNRAGRWDAALVRHQLRSQSIVEMSRSMREGWDECVSYRELLARYGPLGRCGRGEPSRRARSLLRSLPLPASEFAFGRGAVHVRNARTMLVLEGWRSARVRVLVTAVQRRWRECLRARAAARVLQRAYRRHRLRAGARADAAAERAAVVIQRSYRLWVRRRYLSSLWSRLPEGHASPSCRSWPERATAQLQRTDELLAALHHRWRCHRYRFGFDQTARNRMREKVTASVLFKDKKQSYPCSVAHPFVGDYVRLRSSAPWRSRGVRADGYVVFADVVGKVSRAGRVRPVLAVLSTAALLLLEPRSLRVRRRLPAGRLLRLWLSPAADDLLGVTVAEGDAGCAGGGVRGDLLLRALHCIELATKLYLVVQHASGAAPPVLLSSSTTLTLHRDALTVTVHPRGDLPHADRQTAILRRGSELNVLL